MFLEVRHAGILAGQLVPHRHQRRSAPQQVTRRKRCVLQPSIDDSSKQAKSNQDHDSDDGVFHSRHKDDS